MISKKMYYIIFLNYQAHSGDDDTFPEYEKINGIEEIIVVELDTFKISTNRNVKYLFEEFFKTSNTYNYQVADIWNTSDKKSEIFTSQQTFLSSKN